MNNIYSVLSEEFFNSETYSEGIDDSILCKLSDIPYESEEKRNLVINKLQKLNFFIQSGSVHDISIDDYQLINSCIKYVEMNYSLTPEIIESLNKIYLKYHD